MTDLMWTDELYMMNTIHAVDPSWSEEDQQCTGYPHCAYLVMYVGQSIIDKPKYVITRRLSTGGGWGNKIDFIGMADTEGDAKELAERVRGML